MSQYPRSKTNGKVVRSSRPKEHASVTKGDVPMTAIHKSKLISIS
jgi:hypothetical protein